MKKFILVVIMCLFLLSMSTSVFAEELDEATFDVNTLQDENPLNRDIPTINDANSELSSSNEADSASQLKDVSLSGVTLTTAQLRNKFPNGYFWNHYGTANNPDGYTSQPCANHNGYGNPDCNVFDGALQCMGFAFKLGFDYSGVSPRRWQRVYTLNGLAVGDIIRYQNDGHSVFVTATNDQGGISLAECNGVTPRTYCKITWDRYITKNQILNSGFSYVLKCPQVAHTHSFTQKAGEGIHPHREYTYCSCGAINPNAYTGNLIYVDSCGDCRAIGKPTGVTTTVNNKSVTVNWNRTPYTNYYSVYLIQDPWCWSNVKYAGTTTNNTYTFTNVAKGDYKAFIIARPNLDTTQSDWAPAFVAPPTDPVLNSSSKEISLGENITLTPSAKNIIKFNLRVLDSKGETVYTKSDFTGGTVWTPAAVGTYTAWVSAINDLGYTDCPRITLTVKEKEAPATTEAFSDVASDIWYAPFIYDLVGKKILNGKENNCFDPDGNITRAEFTKILAYASGDGLEIYKKTSNFGDSVGHWSEANINWAYDKKIVKGNSETSFAPDNNISRQDMALMIKRYADYKGKALPKTNEAITFADDGQIASWTKDAVVSMQQAGIINGKPGNVFDPEGNALRCEAAKMISIFLSL